MMKFKLFASNRRKPDLKKCSNERKSMKTRSLEMKRSESITSARCSDSAT